MLIAWTSYFHFDVNILTYEWTNIKVLLRYFRDDACMKIKSEDYCVEFNIDTGTITCEGSLLLGGGEEYAPILNLLNAAAAATNEKTKALILDVRDLEFLNSSGINTMTKFVIGVRNRQALNLTVIGQEDVVWQVKLLKNLKRLMPALHMKLE